SLQWCADTHADVSWCPDAHDTRPSRCHSSDELFLGLGLNRKGALVGTVQETRTLNRVDLHYLTVEDGPHSNQIELTLGSSDHERSHSVPDYVHQGSRFAHEAVYAENECHARDRNGRNYREGSDQRDE